MRLTLRTLLAYLDNVLTPTDAATLKQKIQESPKAEQLAERIRLSLTRTELPAMPALGTGSEDPNVPAEYLDSTLSEEKIADFEQDCLAKDGRLAEVADCHKILAEVLTKPVHVPPDLRERAYRLANAAISHDPAWAAHSDGPTAAPLMPPAATGHAPSAPNGNGANLPRAQSTFKGAPPPAPHAVPKKAEVGTTPKASYEYLPQTDSSGRHLTSILVTFGLLGLFLLILTQTLRPLARLFFENQVAKVEADPAVEKTDELTKPPADPLDDLSKSAVATGTDPSGATSPPSDLPDSGPPLPLNESTSVPSKPVVPDANPVNASVVPKESMPPNNGASVDPGNNTVPPFAPVPNATMPPEPEVVVAGELGSLVNDDSLLLLKDMSSGAWLRVLKGAPLASPAQLVSLPYQRSRMLLTGGIDLTIYGTTSLSAASLNTRPIPKIVMEYGRIVLGTTKADAMVPLNLHGVEGNLRLADLRSLVAIEVRMERTLGMNPEVPGNITPVVLVTALQGDVAWEATQGAPQPIEVGQQLTFAKGVFVSVAPPPAPLDWVDAPPPPVTSLEHLAKVGLYELMRTSEVSADLALRDATNHRRSEVVALAAQSLLQVGGADMMFGSDGVLNRASQRAYWNQHFAALQGAISWGPEYAAQVHQAIQQMSAVESEVLYRMLWGFSNDQLAAGDDERLVQWLDHPSMSVRVLAIENLKVITGVPQGMGYRADVEARRPEVQKWLGKMRRGEIRYP